VTTSRPTDTFATRVVRTIDDVNPDVAALVKASGANFNYGGEFLRAYERYPIQRVHDVFYVEVYDAADRLVAFVPCYVQGDPLGALKLPDGELALLSHVWHCSDTRLVGEPTLDVARHVLAAMADLAGDAGLTRFGFINVAVDSPTAHLLEEAGIAGAYVDSRYWLDLRACGDEEGYLATLKGGTRREYRRHLNRARDAGVEVVHRFATADEDHERLELFETSMARVGSAGYYSAEKIASFLTETPSARIIEIQMGGELIAMGIVFVDDTRMHTWAGGWVREEGWSFSPYYLLWAECVRLGFRLGVPTLENGRKNGDFKMRFGLVPLPLNVYVTST
jgi:predicted N-acyltransferase